MKGLDFALLKKVRDEMRDQLTDSKSSGNWQEETRERGLCFDLTKHRLCIENSQDPERRKSRRSGRDRPLIFNVDDEEEEELHPNSYRKVNESALPRQREERGMHVLHRFR